MADTSGWITIKQMVQEILYETDKDDSYYKKFMHHVLNGVREMNKFHYDNIKTVKVTCNSIGVIDFPSDYIQFIGLSMNFGGLLYNLTRQELIVPTTTDVDGDETLDSDIGEGVDLDTGWNYSYATMGGKNDYYYYIDERNYRIIVRSIPTRELFLQYISSGIDLDDGNATTIPVKIKEALKWYVLYKNALASDKEDKKIVQIYKQEYYEELSKLRFLNLPTASELEDMIYSTYSPIRR